MGRTWLVRGIVVTVFAVLAGAWGVGVSGLRDSDSPSVERPPSSPDSSVAPVDERSAAPEKVKPPRTRNAGRTQDATTEASPESSDEPADDAPSTPDPTSPEPTPDSPAPSEEPSNPPPPPDPSDTPSEPSDECTDLAAVIDCVLDPITGHP